MVFYQYGGTPPPFRWIGNFRFFPWPFSFFVWNFKIITYVPWNRFCIILWVRLWSTGLSTLKKEEKKAYLLITFGSQEHNEVYCSPILLNLILLTNILNNNGTLCVKDFLWGGGWGAGFYGWGITPHIGQPCSNSFLDSWSSLIVRQSNLSKLPAINGEGFGEGKGHYLKNILFTFYMFQSI